MKNFADPPDPLIGACLGAAATVVAMAAIGLDGEAARVDTLARELYAAATAKSWERGDDARAVKP